MQVPHAIQSLFLRWRSAAKGSKLPIPFFPGNGFVVGSGTNKVEFSKQNGSVSAL